MLSNKKIICPENLLKYAKSKGTVKAVIVNAGKTLVMESTKQATEAGLVLPVCLFHCRIPVELQGVSLFLFVLSTVVVLVPECLG